MTSWQRRRRVVFGAAALAALLQVAVRAWEEGTPPAAGPVEAQHPLLKHALDRIERGSRSWRAAMAQLHGVGRRAVVVTPDQLVVQTADAAKADVFDPSDVAVASPVADDSGRVTTVVVVVNVERLEAVHRQLGSLPGEFHADLERVLAHEVYGHAVPYLVAGHLSGRCPDPDRRQPATAACAIQRENVIRAELRLGRRTDAALASLALSRGLR